MRRLLTAALLALACLAPAAAARAAVPTYGYSNGKLYVYFAGICSVYQWNSATSSWDLVYTFTY